MFLEEPNNGNPEAETTRKPISEDKIKGALNEMNQENPANSWQVGAVLQNRYTIEQKLGQGGFGIVYFARDNRNNQKVVIKTLKTELIDDKNFE
jgi:serine/threonine protein kinase